LGLNVIRDPNEHAKLLVIGLPLENPNNPDEEDLLERVAETARVAEICKWGSIAGSVGDFSLFYEEERMIARQAGTGGRRAERG